MHVHAPKAPFEHVLVTASDLVEARAKAAEFPGCSGLNPDQHVHLGKIFAEPSDWHMANGLTVKQLCSWCWRRQHAA